MHVTHTCRVNLHRPLQLTKHLLFKTCLTHFSLRGERIQSLRYKSLREEQHNIKVEKPRPKKRDDYKAQTTKGTDRYEQRVCVTIPPTRVLRVRTDQEVNNPNNPEQAN